MGARHSVSASTVSSPIISNTSNCGKGYSSPPEAARMNPVAVVMNVYYTGLGIARSLGERGVRVIGLTSQRGVYGNFTRYAKIRMAPDSRHQPEALAEYLVRLGQELGDKSVLYPTRDDDVIFLNRFRK